MEYNAQNEAHVAAAIKEAFAGDDIGAESIERMVQEGCNFKEAMQALLNELLGNDELLEGIKAREVELKERKSRITHKGERIRSLIQSCMDIAGEGKITLPEATISKGKSRPKVIVVHESEIPERYIKIERKPMLNDIAKALGEGETVEGCILSNGGETLTIRTK